MVAAIQSVVVIVTVTTEVNVYVHFARARCCAKHYKRF